MTVTPVGVAATAGIAFGRYGEPSGVRGTAWGQGYGPGVEIAHDGLTLHVAEDGPAHGRPVVLLHGITSSGGTWNWLVPLLADRHRVLRLDFRGHGRSGRSDVPYDYSGYVSDAVAVCEQAANQPAVVIGHSLGGGAAAALAQQRPDLVRAVLLEDPALAGSTEIGDNSLLEGFTLMRDLIPQVQASGMLVDDLVDAIAALDERGDRTTARRGPVRRRAPGDGGGALGA